MTGKSGQKLQEKIDENDRKKWTKITGKDGRKWQEKVDENDR